VTKAAELKELKSLKRKCLSLWRIVVKLRAGGRCESGCKVTKALHCHHIESYSTNKALRYDPRNGGLLCASHHKFGKMSAHKSFVFMYLLMTGKRKSDLDYLVEHFNDKIEITKEYLLDKINELETTIESLKGGGS